MDFVYRVHLTLAILGLSTALAYSQPPPDLLSDQSPQTPSDMALLLERELARFSGLAIPVTNHVFAHYMGVLPFPETASANGFPEAFIHGLAPVEEFEIETYPVTVRVDDATGDTVFYNAQGIPFWEESANDTYEPDWVLKLFGKGPHSILMQELLRPSHVKAQWVFVSQENISAYHTARLDSLRTSPGEKLTREESDLPQLYVTDFIPTDNAFYFASAWNHVTYFPLKKMNVLFSSDLRSPSWTVVQTVAVPNNSTGRASVFEVPRVKVPDEPLVPFAHDASCAPVTNVVVSPLDMGISYTNATCSCAREKSPAGFFRLEIPDPSVNIPTWWRVLYGFAPYDSWEDYIDFNNTGLSNIDKYGLGLPPVTPPNPGATATTIQYHYDDDDRLTATFIGAEGDASILHISPAGNPEVQQERTVP